MFQSVHRKSQKIIHNGHAVLSSTRFRRKAQNETIFSFACYAVDPSIPPDVFSEAKNAPNLFSALDRVRGAFPRHPSRLERNIPSPFLTTHYANIVYRQMPLHRAKIIFLPLHALAM